MLRAVLSAVFGFAILISATSACADSQQVMNQMLDAYINVTPASRYETQTRGGITLGSVSTRSRIVKPNLISIIPPGIHGDGCQLDLIGGSFSFINGEQLQQYLRSIASNALNYAFTLALEGVCPTCMQQIEKLRDWSDTINGMLQDSCHAAKALVNATDLDDWYRERMASAENNAVQHNVFTDAFESRQKTVSEIATDQTIGESTAINAVWDAMKKSQTAGWFGAVGDDELAEVIMSVTGTLVKTEIDDSGAPCESKDATNEYCFHDFLPLLDVEQFVEGSDAAPVRLYHCSDNYTQCLKPVIVERQWPGLKRRIREILFGPFPGFTGGLVYKLRDKTNNYTEAERRFIEGAPFSVYSTLRNVAQSEGALYSMGEALQELIAVPLARRLVLEMISTVNQSFGIHSIQMSAAMREKLRDRMTQFQTRVSFEDRELDNQYKILQVGEDMGRALRESLPSAAPTGPAAKSKR